MNKFTVYGYDRSEQFEHVHKATARKAYNEGKTIAIDGCKMSPFNVWNTTVIISKEGEDAFYGDDETHFDSVVNSFEYYNCNSAQGRRAAFYMKVGDAK